MNNFNVAGIMDFFTKHINTAAPIIFIASALVLSIIVYYVFIKNVKEVPFEEAKQMKKKVKQELFQELEEKQKIKTKKQKKNKQKTKSESSTETEKVVEKVQKEFNKNTKNKQTPKDTNKAETKLTESDQKPPVIKSKVADSHSFETSNNKEEPKVSAIKIENGEKSVPKTELQKTTKKKVEKPKPIVKEVVEIKEVVVENKVEENTDECTNDKIEMTLQLTAGAEDKKDKKSQILIKGNKSKKTGMNAINDLLAEKESITVNLVMNILEKTEFSKEDTQQLIDYLLNIQSNSSEEWFKGRQDPLVKIKKQLIEKEKALQIEQEGLKGMQNKLKELREELNKEKVNAKTYYNSLQEKTITAQKLEEDFRAKDLECKDLSAQIQDLIDNKKYLLDENAKLRKELENGKTELRAMENLLKQLDKALETKTSEEQCTKEAIFALKNQVNDLAVQIQELQNINETLNSQIQDGAHIQEIASLTHEIQQSKSQIDSLNKNVQKLKQENTNLSSEKNRLTTELTTVTKNQTEEKLNNEKFQAKEIELIEKEAAAEKKFSLLLSEHELLKADFAQSEQLNVELKNVVDELVEKCEMMKLQLDEVNATLNSVKDSTSDELNKLRSDMESCRAKNDELRHKNRKIMEALNSAEDNLRKKCELLNSSNKVTVVDDKFRDIKVRITEILGRLQPHMKVPESEDMETWFEKLNDFLDTAIINNDECSDLKKENAKLRAKADQYKSIITYLENTLEIFEEKIKVEDVKVQKLYQQISSMKFNSSQDVANGEVEDS